MDSRDASFTSHGDRCAARLFIPGRGQQRDGSRPPLVIMAHGLGLTANQGLLPYIQHFVRAGFAALVFDYRGFGPGSDAAAQEVHPRRHIEDWHGALAHARTLAEVDADRLFLWGTSLSGGHVLCVAADDPQISGVIAQIPCVDGLASTRTYPWTFVVRALAHGVFDLVRGALTGRPHCIPLVGQPPGLAFIAKTDWRQAVRVFAKGEPAGRVRSSRARGLLRMPFYRPTRVVHRIQCPVLMIAARDDTLIPLAVVERAAARIRDCRLVTLAMGHFDPFFGAPLRQMLDRELAFLAAVIAARSPQPAALPLLCRAS